MSLSTYCDSNPKILYGIIAVLVISIVCVGYYAWKKKCSKESGSENIPDSPSSPDSPDSPDPADLGDDGDDGDEGDEGDEGDDDDE